MGLDISKFSPAAQKQIHDKLMQQNVKQSKYHNQPAVRGGVRFDSQKEARRYDELMILLRKGLIRDLKLQPQYTLQEAYTTPEGNRVRAIRYQADFSYEQMNQEIYGGWEPVVEDVKSKATMTRVYEIKKKLLFERHGITITEVE